MVSDELIAFAWSRIRSKTKSFVGNVNAVACLSRQTVEDILKDTETEMTEFELFTLLVSWVSSREEERKPLAQKMLDLIKLEKISPGHLSSRVEPSGLATMEQLCLAYKTHSIVTAKEYVERGRLRPTLPVWSNTGTVRAGGGSGEFVWEFLKCDSINSGVYEWALEKFSPELETDLLFGIISKESVSSLNPKTWLTAQRGSWGFDDSGRFFDGEKISTSDWNLSHGDRVTLTLDLSTGSDGNGTLGGRIEEEDGDEVSIEPISILLGCSTIGFVPSVACNAVGGFKLLSFIKIKD